MTSYTGTRIKHYGTINIPCRHEANEWTPTTFYVAESDGPVIIGLPSCRILKLITVHCEITEKLERPYIKGNQHLKALYPSRYEEKIGNFPGYAHLTLRDGAPGHIEGPKKYPIMLRGEMKQELVRMENLGVIAKVTEPTDWVSGMAFSRKENGNLRICICPTHLNKWLKRTHHKTPTIEEITHKLSGAQVLSKVDARHGYWSIKLDHGSSLLTTFNTPFGRYRYLRLPFGLNVSQDIFQEKMDQILENCPGTVNIADDILVYGKDDHDHDEHMHNFDGSFRQTRDHLQL